jgi:hypothetical protein
MRTYKPILKCKICDGYIKRPNSKEICLICEIKRNMDKKEYQLMNKILKWRNRKARQVDLLEGIVLKLESIEQIGLNPPKTIKELFKIKGISSARVRDYGEELIKVITDFHSNDVSFINKQKKKKDSEKKGINTGHLSVEQKIDDGERRKRVSKQNYQKFFRKKVMGFFPKCVNCGSRKDLNIHHKTYNWKCENKVKLIDEWTGEDNGWYYDCKTCYKNNRANFNNCVANVMILCSKCHKDIHKKLNKDIGKWVDRTNQNKDNF